MLKKTLIILCSFALISSSNAQEGPRSFADIVEPLLSSVVNISTTQEVERRSELDHFNVPDGSPLEDFFKRFQKENENLPQRRRKATSLGSGFIIHKSGFIVTNNHVVDGADEIKVLLSNKKEYEAKIIGKDSRTDIALLKIDTEMDLPSVKFGDSEKIRIGDWVIAIGNPLGLGGSVTAGIVSARGRDIQSGPYDNYIQTDAPINRGNSGGPLFNLEGEVIGINTAIFSQTGGSIGIGFAIPSFQAKKVINQLKEFGETKRGWLGVTIQEVTTEIAESLGLKEAKGALVAAVHPGGPSDKAGVNVGDIILVFDGDEISSSRELPRIVADRDIDKEVDVVIFRDGKEITLEVILGRLELALKEIQGEEEDLSAGKLQHYKTATLGLALHEMNNELRDRFDISPNTEGLVVVNIDEESIAFERGIRVGDVIAVVNQTAVSSVKEFEAIVKKAKKQTKKVYFIINLSR